MGSQNGQGGGYGGGGGGQGYGGWGGGGGSGFGGGYGRPSPRMGYGGGWGQQGGQQGGYGGQQGNPWAGLFDALSAYGGWGRPQGQPAAAPVAPPAQPPGQAIAPGQNGTAPGFAQPPAFDYGQVFGNLYGQNPAAAYKFVDGTDPGAGDWFQKNQMQIRDSRFGGNQDAMNQWTNSSFYNNDRSLRDMVNSTVSGYRR